MSPFALLKSSKFLKRSLLGSFVFLFSLLNGQNTVPKFDFSANIGKMFLFDTDKSSGQQSSTNKYTNVSPLVTLRMDWYNRYMGFHHFGLAVRLNSRAGNYSYITESNGGGMSNTGDYNLSRADLQVFYFLPADPKGQVGFSFGMYMGKTLTSAGTNTFSSFGFFGANDDVITTGGRNVSRSCFGTSIEFRGDIPIFHKTHFITLSGQIFIESGEVGGTAKGTVLSLGYTFRKHRKSMNEQPNMQPK